MARQNNNFTILIIPDDNSKSVSMHINRFIIRALAFVFVTITIGIAVLVYRSADIAVKMQLVSTMVEENRELREKNDKLEKLTSTINQIEIMNSYFNRIALHSDIEVAPVTEPSTLARVENQPVFEKDGHDSYLDSIRILQTRDIYKEKKAFFESLPYVRPVEGWITRRFRPHEPENNAIHLGVDFAAAAGTPIRATAPGIVSEVYNDPFLGLVIVLEHQRGFHTRYGHCKRLLVSTGSHVQRGQTIALVGNTGRSSGPHVHYEILKDGQNVDPLKYIISEK